MNLDEDFQKQDRIMKMIFVYKGGDGSGHHGHAGRPGKVGGSLPKGEHDEAYEARRARQREALRAWRARQREQYLPDIKMMKTIGNVPDWTISNEHYERGVTDSYRVEITNDGKAIVKPGVNLYSDYDSNDPYKEEDAYLLAKELGFGDLVPVSVAVKDKTGELIGGNVVAEPENMTFNNYNEMLSVQQWIEGCVTFGDFDNKIHFDGEPKISADDEVFKDSLEQIAWLDAIIGNTDRHLRNMLIKPIEKDGKTYYKAVAIDHGLAWMVAPYANRRIHKPIEIVKSCYNSLVVGNLLTVFDNFKFNKTYYNRAVKFLNGNSKLLNKIRERYGQQFIDEAKIRVADFARDIARDASWK